MYLRGLGALAIWCTMRHTAPHHGRKRCGLVDIEELVATGMLVEHVVDEWARASAARLRTVDGLFAEAEGRAAKRIQAAKLTPPRALALARERQVRLGVGFRVRSSIREAHHGDAKNHARSLEVGERLHVAAVGFVAVSGLAGGGGGGACAAAAASAGGAGP